jgi:hypothetical protein
MSILGILDAMRSDRAPAERLVWQCLENHADPRRCWRMTEQAIAAELKLGRNTVTRAIRALATDGILEVERHIRRPTLFRLLRVYSKTNGHGEPSEAELAPQNGDSTASESVHPPNLSPQNGHSNPELTPQIGHQTPKLSPHFGDSVDSTSKTPPEKNPPVSAREARRECDHPDFDAFWDRYPRKVGRRAASGAFTAAVKRGHSPADIVAGVEQCRFSPEVRYQPHPKTWLNADRWLDEEDGFDPVLRAVGLKPEDFLDLPPGGLLQ